MMLETQSCQSSYKNVWNPRQVPPHLPVQCSWLIRSRRWSPGDPASCPVCQHWCRHSASHSCCPQSAWSAFYAARCHTDGGSSAQTSPTGSGAEGGLLGRDNLLPCQHEYTANAGPAESSWLIYGETLIWTSRIWKLLCQRRKMTRRWTRNWKTRQWSILAVSLSPHQSRIERKPLVQAW